MKTMAKLNLQLKIIGIVFLISFLIFSILSYVHIKTYTEDLTDSFVRRAKATVQSLESGIEKNEDVFDKNKILQNIQKQIWLDPDILEINFNVPEGDKLMTYASNNPNNIEKTADQDNTMSYTADKIITIFCKHKECRSLSVITPVHVSGKISGTYQMKITLESIDRKISEELRLTIILFTVLMLIFIFSLFIVLKKLVINPISQISTGLEAVSKNDFSQIISVKSKDEIGALASSFESMKQAIKASRNELKKYSDNLEKKIKERTAQLSKKVDELTAKDSQIIKINKDLEQMNQKLKELDKEKDEFISVAAHELKTPLTSIKGFSQLLKNPEVMNDKSKRVRYLELINTNTIRLYNLILDIVDSSRLSLGKIQLEIKENDVLPIFKEIKDNMGVIIEEKGIKPEFIIESNLPSIKADSARLLQVLKNLLINAVHFTEKGVISLKVYRSGKFIQFEVKDTGEGIPKSKQGKIFSKFYQADSSLTRKIKGSGLGLSLSKGFVEAMGGKIWFYSDQGKGTAFYFTIPAAKKRR